MVTRFNASVKVRNLDELSRQRGKVTLRVIRSWGSGSDARLLTNELDASKLPPLGAAALHRKR